MTGKDKQLAMWYAVAYLDGAVDTKTEDDKSACIDLGEVTENEWENFELNRTKSDRLFLGYKAHDLEGNYKGYELIVMIERYGFETVEHMLHVLITSIDCKRSELKTAK